MSARQAGNCCNLNGDHLELIVQLDTKMLVVSKAYKIRVYACIIRPGPCSCSDILNESDEAYHLLISLSLIVMSSSQDRNQTIGRLARGT